MAVRFLSRSWKSMRFKGRVERAGAGEEEERMEIVRVNVEERRGGEIKTFKGVGETGFYHTPPPDTRRKPV